MNPIDLATEQTLSFVRAHLPDRALRLLEVGCGRGELAGRLQAHGHQVVALDSSAEAVAQARQLGVDARLAQWPEFTDAPFDALLFSRSLHHIHPLEEAVAQADRLLQPGGLIIVEDFSYDEATAATVEWLYSTLAILDAAGRLSLPADSLASALLSAGGGLECWHLNHDHHLHRAPTMLDMLTARFQPVVQTTAPYLYRYLCPALPDNDEGYAIAARVLCAEERLAQAGVIVLIGRRFVGRQN